MNVFTETHFTEHPKFRKSAQNEKPVFRLTWDLMRNGQPVLDKNGVRRRTGSEWDSEVYANEVFRRKTELGLNPKGDIIYVCK